MKIVYTSTFIDSFIQIPIEAGNNYPHLIYTVAGQYLFPYTRAMSIFHSKRVPIQKTK